MTPRQKRVIDVIKRLERESPSGEVTPRGLWEAARDVDHPLHDEFEWDDSVAADAWRDEQARRLLRIRVTVIHETKSIHAPICVRTPDAQPGAQGYTRLVTILEDDNREKARRVFVEEIDRARRAIERARNVADALGLADECAAVLEKLVALARRHDEAAE